MSTIATCFGSLRRELLVAALFGAPALVYVLMTNRTASRPLIVLHGFLLLWLVPLCVSLAEPAATAASWCNSHA